MNTRFQVGLNGRKPVLPKERFRISLRKLAVAVVIPAVLLSLFEFGLRIFHYQYTPREKILWTPSIAEYIGTYEYFIPTSLEPPGYVWRAKPDTRLTDLRGFRLPGVPDRKAPGKTRIAFLGGSTSMSGYHAYPERTIRLMNEVAGMNRYEHLNAACSSYSTHQSLLALKRWVLPLKPDHVVVYHGWNDGFLQADGYSDLEKDALARLGVSSRSNAARWVRSLKVTEAVGQLLAVLDRSWPRARVDLRQFEKNLREMAALCAANHIKLSLVTRPLCHDRPLPDTGENYLQYYGRVYGTRDPDAIYTRIHADQLTVVKKVAADFDHVDVIDASAFVDELQRRQSRGEFGTFLKIFREDACHLYDFANQKLAEFMAQCLIPEQADALARLMDSAEYRIALAGESLREEDPFAAVYYAEQAQQQTSNTALSARCQEIITAGTARYEFARLFREARWGGSDGDFDSKIWKLRTCQAMRPDNIGVCLQILRVCHYMGRAADAVRYMDLYQPSSDPAGQYEYLSYLFHSHTEGGRWMPAAEVAKKMLQLNPDDEEAKEYLAQYRRTGGH